MNGKWKEKLADEIDLELDRQARKAHNAFERDHDHRWKDTYMKIDAARGAVRKLMSEKDRQATMDNER